MPPLQKKKQHFFKHIDHATSTWILDLTVTYPLTAMVFGALQIISQPVSSIFLCSPLPSGTWQTPGLFIPWCYLPTSSSICLVIFTLSVCHKLPCMSLCMRCVVSCGNTSFPWLIFFFAALLWGSMIHKHTGRWMWQGSRSVISWNWENCSCHSKLVSTLSMLLSSVLS